MSEAVAEKSPGEAKDYGNNWVNVLTGENEMTISSSSWAAVPTGLTLTTASIVGTKTIVWVSGGSVNTDYALLNTITTPGGRTHDWTIIVPCRTR